jgi:hypothetical protein
VTNDDIGDRGQSICFLLLTELCGRPEPFFRPRFLGDKFPTFDYIVELVDHPGMFFFVQVKATTKLYTKTNPQRLLVQVSQTDVDRMVGFRAPTYVVGIDETTKHLGFLLSVNETRDHVASLITSFRIDCVMLQVLHDEVRDYWQGRDMVLKGSRFKE